MCRLITAIGNVHNFIRNVLIKKSDVYMDIQLRVVISPASFRISILCYSILLQTTGYSINGCTYVGLLSKALCNFVLTHQWQRAQRADIEGGLKNIINTLGLKQGYSTKF